MHRSGSRGGPGRASARWTPRRCRPRPGWSTSTGTRRRRPSRRRSSRRACAPARESPGRPARNRAGGPSTPRRRRCARAALGTASVPLAWPQCGTEASVPPGLRRCPGGARFGIFVAMPLLNESASESPVGRCRLLSGCTASSRVRADTGVSLSGGSKRWPARIFHPRSRAPPVPKCCNDAIPRERRSSRAPESYAPATFFRTVDAPGLLPDSGGGTSGQEIISVQPADAPGLRRRSFRRLRRSRTAIDRARSAAEGSSVLVVEDLDLDHPVHHGQDRQ